MVVHSLRVEMLPERVSKDKRLVLLCRGAPCRPQITGTQPVFHLLHLAAFQYLHNIRSGCDHADFIIFQRRKLKPSVRLWSLLELLADGDMHMHADACTSTGMHDGASKIDANDANKQLAISNLKETENTIVFSTKKTTKQQKRFTHPSVEEVAAYCRERKNAVNAEQFCDYYTANGWKVGRHSMKDWKAAVRTWEHKEAEKGTADNDRWTADNL